MKAIKPHEKKLMHKELDKLNSLEESIIFLKNKEINELKLFAKLLNTSLYTTYFEINSVEATKNDLIEDINETLWG